MITYKTLTVSSPPHIYGKTGIDSRMRDVLIALTPAGLVGIYAFGPEVLLTIAVTVLSAVLAEFLFQRVNRKPVTVNDFSAVVTGLLLAYNLPPAIPLWLCALGSFFAIIAVKQLFGGLGSNFMNPALAARAFLLAAFPVHMTTWTFPEADTAADAVASATFLNILRDDPAFVPQMLDYIAVITGMEGGCVGETSSAALLAGGLYLILRRVINWRIPVFYIGSFAVFAFIFGRQGLFTGQYILFEILSGGLILGAFFMATDYATSPISPGGKIIMGIGCGFFTVIIRFYGGYPEGVSYAILIMNIFVPTIDKYVKPRVFGTKRKYPFWKR
jgi:electron transport complex protein RnfD